MIRVYKSTHRHHTNCLIKFHFSKQQTIASETRLFLYLSIITLFKQKKTQQSTGIPLAEKNTLSPRHLFQLFLWTMTGTFHEPSQSSSAGLLMSKEVKMHTEINLIPVWVETMIRNYLSQRKNLVLLANCALTFIFCLFVGFFGQGCLFFKIKVFLYPTTE